MGCGADAESGDEGGGRRGGGCMEAAAAVRVEIKEKSQREEREMPNAGWSSIALLVPAEKRGAEMG